MRELHADDARFAMWYPYPRLAVAELAPPKDGHTSWDFSYMDPLMADFAGATSGQPFVLTISTIPQWMFKGPDSGQLPSNPDEAVWNYEQGTRLRDNSLGEVSGYFERVARWYMDGGFRDEPGMKHTSDHHYAPGYWEVLNEPEFEHSISPEYYTRIYDAVVKRVHRAAPGLKFVGMSLAEPDKGTHFFEYFLDRAHHKRGIPLDAVSYHFYALGHTGETGQQQASSYFEQADHFLQTVDKLEAIRTRLSPQTETQINETGCIAANDLSKASDSMNGKDISPSYWQLCGAMFAYLYGNLAAKGIDLLGASQLLGYPTQFPSVSLVDWNTGQPNPRYMVLQLLMKSFGPGDELIDVPLNTPQLYAQAFRRNGDHKILLVNKTTGDITIKAAGITGGKEVHLDIPTKPPASSVLSSEQVTLGPLGVMVITLAHGAGGAF